MNIFSCLHSCWAVKSLYKRTLVVILFVLFVFNLVLFIHVHNRPKEARVRDETLPISEKPQNDPVLTQPVSTIKETVSSTQKDKVPLTQKESILTKENEKVSDTEENEVPPTKEENVLSAERSACPRMTINRQDEIERFSKNRACHPHLPTEEICQYTAELFSVDPSIEKCHDQKGAPYNLCSIVKKRTQKHNRTLEMKCDLSACSRKKPMHLKIVNPSNGDMLVLKAPGTSDKVMQRFVEDVAKMTQKNGFNFLFVECVGLKYGKNVSQMLTVFPPEKTFRPQKQISNKRINVNIVLLDSISRAHFFRSLPKTVQFLQEKQNDPNYHAHIFDFELFQAVHGHTHENEHALFSGTLYPESWSPDEKDSAPTNIDVLFGLFKQSGYQTMHQTDMCWKSYFGHMMNFKASGWEDLREKLKPANSNIDSTGISDASCEIYSRYGKSHPFNDDQEHQICFNGKHHHRHLFDYITNYLQAINKRRRSKPLFSYTETDVSHDDTGVRVRTLDRDLAEFIDLMAKDPNTFTIILADHGNTYTTYQIKMLEGRLEMYHPILLAVVPKQLDKKLGKNILTNLKTNQYRLLNNLDIRAGIVELAKYDGKYKLNPVGILGKISKKRTCNDLQLSTPNYCLCEGWDMPVANSTAQMALAEFAIGQLNNQIQKSLLASQGDRNPSHQGSGLFGACQRLRIQSIHNVRERTTEGTMVTTMDVKLQSANILDQEELITIQVASNQRKGDTFEMRLVSHNRISQFGMYRQCVDPGVDVKLCICNKPTKPTNDVPDLSSVLDIAGTSSTVRELKPCLYLIKRIHQENKDKQSYVGVEVYEVANVCDSSLFTVRFAADTSNLRSATDLPTTVTLKGKSVYFVTVFMTEVGYWEARLKWNLHIEQQN